MGDDAKSILDKIQKRTWAVEKVKKNIDYGALTDDYWFNDIEEPKKTEEELLREEFPSLQDAWEKYQIVLKMCKASKPAPEPKLNPADILAEIRKRRNQPGGCTDKPVFKGKKSVRG